MAKLIEVAAHSYYVYTYGELLEKNKEGEVYDYAMEKAREWMNEGVQTYDWWDYTFEMWKQALDQIGFTDAEIYFSGFSHQGDGACFESSVDAELLLRFMGSKTLSKGCIESTERTGEKEDFWPWLIYEIRGGEYNAETKTHTEQNQPLPYQNHRYDWLAEIACDHISATIKRTEHRYSHEYTCDFEAELDEGSADERGVWIDGENGGYGHWQSAIPEVVETFNDFVKDAEELRRDLCRAIYRYLEIEYEYLISDEAHAESSDANEYMFTIEGEHEIV